MIFLFDILCTTVSIYAVAGLYSLIFDLLTKDSKNSANFLIFQPTKIRRIFAAQGSTDYQIRHKSRYGVYTVLWCVLDFSVFGKF